MRGWGPWGRVTALAALRPRVLLPVLLAATLLGTGPAADDARARRPSVLFATPGVHNTYTPAWLGFVEPRFVRSLTGAASSGGGMEVDFLDTLNDLNGSRLALYDAVVLFVSPRAVVELQKFGSAAEDEPTVHIDPEAVARFVPAVSTFVRRGGGVLLLPSEQNWHTQQLFEL